MSTEQHKKGAAASLRGEAPHGKNRLLLQEIRSQRNVLPAPSPFQHWRSVVGNMATWLLHGAVGFIYTGFMVKCLICAQLSKGWEELGFLLQISKDSMEVLQRSGRSFPPLLQLFSAQQQREGSCWLRQRAYTSGICSACLILGGSAC